MSNINIIAIIIINRNSRSAVSVIEQLHCAFFLFSLFICCCCFVFCCFYIIHILFRPSREVTLKKILEAEVD